MTLPSDLPPPTASPADALPGGEAQAAGASADATPLHDRPAPPAQAAFEAPGEAPNAARPSEFAGPGDSERPAVLRAEPVHGPTPAHAREVRAKTVVSPGDAAGSAPRDSRPEAPQAGATPASAPAAGASPSRVDSSPPRRESAQPAPPPPPPGPGGAAAFQGAAASAAPAVRDQTFPVLAHLVTLVSIPLPAGNLFGMLAAVLLYLVRGQRDSVFVHHARESIQFQVNSLVWMLAATAFFWWFPPLHALVLFLLLGFNVLAAVVGAVRCANGELYRYPLTVRFLRT